MRAPSGTLVLQSHRRPLPGAWLERCVESVRDWARARGYRYRFEGDELFERLAPELRARTATQPAIAADLARLAAARQALDAGFDAVVWLDADMLVLDGDALALPQTAYAVGREVWVQPASGGLRRYVRVHNAFLMFRPGNPFLDFYRHAAERIVLAHDGRMVPQLVGPKLLAVLHNLMGLPVAERFGMLSPTVARDLLAGGGPALASFRAGCTVAPAAVNLCASLVGREIGKAEIGALIDCLLDGNRGGMLLSGRLQPSPQAPASRSGPAMPAES